VSDVELGTPRAVRGLRAVLLSDGVAREALGGTVGPRGFRVVREVYVAGFGVVLRSADG